MDDSQQQVATALPSKQQLPRHHPDRLRILAFGDSLTEGYTDFGMSFNPYGNVLEATLSGLVPSLAVSVDIEGESGDCVLLSHGGNFQRRLTRAYEAAAKASSIFDLAIVLGGTNDLAYKLEAGLTGAEEIFQGLKLLYEHILNAGTSLIVMTVPARAIDTRSSRLAVRARANREHLNRLITIWAGEQAHNRTRPHSPRVWLFDLAPLVPFPQDKGEDDTTPFDETIWSPDGLHMSASGYEFVGHELAAFIKGVI